MGGNSKKSLKWSIKCLSKEQGLEAGEEVSGNCSCVEIGAKLEAWTASTSLAETIEVLFSVTNFRGVAVNILLLLNIGWFWMEEDEGLVGWETSSAIVVSCTGSGPVREVEAFLHSVHVQQRIIFRQSSLEFTKETTTSRVFSIILGFFVSAEEGGDTTYVDLPPEKGRQKL